MYTPIHNRETDRAKIIAFMREYPFATLVTTRDGNMTATHLPVLIDDQNDQVFLTAHLARANVQWRDFGSAKVQAHDALMIFQEPHAFISTRHYEPAQSGDQRPSTGDAKGTLQGHLSVPTWNYVAVHAYGAPRLLESLDERLKVVERMVQQFEGTLEQFDSLPDDFKQTKANGIVAFEICVTRLDARFKLSQDRTRVEQERIVQALSARPENVEFEIGAMMQEKLSWAQ